MSRRVTHTAHSSDESSLFKITDSIDEETDGSSLTLAQINSPKCNIKDSDVDDGTDMAGSSLMLPALVQTKDDGGNVRVRSKPEMTVTPSMTSSTIQTSKKRLPP